MNDQPERTVARSRRTAVAAARRLDPVSLRLFRAAFEKHGLAQAVAHDMIALLAIDAQVEIPRSPKKAWRAPSPLRRDGANDKRRRN